MTPFGKPLGTRFGNLLGDLRSWPVFRQAVSRDARGLGRSAQSPRSASLQARTSEADRWSTRCARTAPWLRSARARPGGRRRGEILHADAIVVMGSNMAECHPVGFQWAATVVRAARGSPSV